MDREPLVKNELSDFIIALEKENIIYKSMEREYEFESSSFKLNVVAPSISHLSCYEKIDYIATILFKTTTYETRIKAPSISIFDNNLDYENKVKNCISTQELEYC